MANNGLEIEIKLAAADLATARKLLRRAGARAVRRVYERNTLFDTPERKLGFTGRVLRVRTVQRAAGTARPRHPAGTNPGRKRKVGFLTVKTPLDQPGYKVRREIETRVEDPGQVERMLESVGFQPWFRYEKFRTTYRLPGLKNLAIELDETSIGVYFELEGPRSEIDKAARKLGYAPDDYLTVSYYELFLAARERLGLPSDAMVFPEAVKPAPHEKK